MDTDEAVEIETQDLLVKHKDEITPAYQRAVREAVLRHKRNGHSIAIWRDGEVVVLQGEEIEAELERAAQLLKTKG
jgi:hypothetical protein